jgi:hypothetical protein
MSNDNVNSLVKSWNPSFIITVGDNNYERGEASTIVENIGKYYCDFMYNPGAPAGQVCTGRAANEKTNYFFPSLGNHDWYYYDPEAGNQASKQAQWLNMALKKSQSPLESRFLPSSSILV